MARDWNHKECPFIIRFKLSRGRTCPIQIWYSDWQTYALEYSRPWVELKDELEICPPGYRRPNNGSTTNNTPISSPENSEMNQSLFAYPISVGETRAQAAISFVKGYYADGYFDRRPRNPAGYGNTTSPGDTDIAVSWTTTNVATVGMLFYNPLSGSDRYNASLFFPAGGIIHAYSYLAQPGSLALYATSTISGYNYVDQFRNPHTLRLNLKAIVARLTAEVSMSSDCRVANSLRCVRE